MLEGLARLDYRGYDSTGLVIDQEAIDKDTHDHSVLPFKIVGKVADLRKFIAEQLDVDLSKSFLSHVAIAHTRWAANGKATVSNCHPIRFVYTI
jgi:glucosamine--fructose-6-phosphate aminotransferase (isomerizing)